MKLNRRDVLSKCPEGAEDFTKELLDSFEAAIHNIRDLLSICSIYDIENIEKAYRNADKLADDLY